MTALLLRVACSVVCASTASLLVAAVSVPLQNPGFETGAATFWYSPQAGVPGVVTHAAYPHPGNGTLGAFFGYYSPGDAATTWCGQIVPTNLTADTGYRFQAWLSDGGSVSGYFEIGYLHTDGDWNSYQALSRAQYHISNTWHLYPGATYITEPELAGKQIAVRFPPAPGNSGGVWIDDAQLYVLTPAPAIGWCNLQWPHTAMVVLSNETVYSENIYGQIWIDGVTSQSGATPGLKAWLGLGPSNAPPDAASWTWTPAEFNVDVGNNDEFWTNIAVASSVTPGVYAYCYKYQYDTNELPSDVRYGLKYGMYTLATYDPAQAGVLTVVPEPGVWLAALCAVLLSARRS